MAQVDGSVDYSAALTDAERVLDHVVEALGRLDDGTYGACVHCGAAISDERLALDPTARSCELHLELRHMP